MLRHELEEPGYFANKNVRVYTSDGREVNPRAIDWKQVKDGGSFPYRLKQDAGPENALGPMKLDFKNDYAVFIHGTSSPKLFEKQDRFFSSGCVRVDDPLGLATFLIQDDPAWNRARVDEDDAKGVADLRSKGMTVIDNVDKAKFVAALAPVNAEFEKQFGKANIDKIRAVK